MRWNSFKNNLKILMMFFILCFSFDIIRTEYTLWWVSERDILEKTMANPSLPNTLSTKWSSIPESISFWSATKFTIGYKLMREKSFLLKIQIRFRKSNLLRPPHTRSPWVYIIEPSSNWMIGPQCFFSFFTRHTNQTRLIWSNLKIIRKYVVTPHHTSFRKMPP